MLWQNLQKNLSQSNLYLIVFMIGLIALKIINAFFAINLQSSSKIVSVKKSSKSQDFAKNAKTECSPMILWIKGIKVHIIHDKLIVYDMNSNLTREQTEAIGKYLIREGFFGNIETITILTKRPMV
jgi:hypothetical protein